MKKLYNIKAINFTDDFMDINIDGKSFQFKLVDISEKLVKASKAEREKFEISPSGYGISWPLLDEDLSINGLLGVKQSPVNIRNNVHV